MYQELYNTCKNAGATLVAVSKTKPVAEIERLYALGHRDFGENYVQELVDKYEQLPKDIRWHFIGTLQRNKVKYIAPFVHLIHGIDSIKLLAEVNKRAQQNGRVIDILLQVHVAEESTKHGFSAEELQTLFEENELFSQPWTRISGLMAMATFTDKEAQIKAEFNKAKELFDTIDSNYFSSQSNWTSLSMGMSSDYHIALENGSNMVRIGSLLFGKRN